jgi:two-component system chemotaxis sensor kinase CheA
MVIKIVFAIMPPASSVDPLDELRALYAVEADEHITTLNHDLLALEAANTSAERQKLLESLERAAHSLKGASRVVGMTAVESVAHPLETVFRAVKSETLALTPAIADVLYDALDTLGALLNNEAIELEPLIAGLASLVAKPDQAANVLKTLEVPKPPEPRENKVPSEAVIAPKRSTELTAVATTSAADRPNETAATIRVATHRLDDLLTDVGDLLITAAGYEQRTASLQLIRQAHQRWQRDWRRVRTAYLRAVRAATPEWPMLLDFLNATQRYMRVSDQMLTALEQGLTQDNLHLRRIVTSLQDNTRQTRLVPFETHVALVQRAVRDLARELAKEVTLEISGAALELDRQVLEAIADPLLHLARNAVDHGFESPAAREAVGKPRMGTLHISLSQRGGELTITVSDDGAGIDVALVRQQARRILHPIEVDSLNDSEALTLVMLPGLSTRTHVTAISGRGVGLDVVRRNVEVLHGRVEIDSVLGHGTTFRLIVPISMSTIRCMLVRVGTDTYAIPTTAIEQVIRIRPDEPFVAGGRRLLKVGARTLPLAHPGDVARFAGRS